jgi:small subunit ribosomal protein S16
LVSTHVLFSLQEIYLLKMSVKIRLQRGGTTHTPHYRIVVAESRFPRDGRFIEVLGTYHPVAKRRKDKCLLKLDRADHWLGVGAQPSDTVRGLINRFRRGFYEVVEEEEPKPAAVTPAPVIAPEPSAEEPVAEVAAEEESPKDAPEEVAEEATAEATEEDSSEDAAEEESSEDAPEEVAEEATAEATEEDSSEDAADEDTSGDAPKEVAEEAAAETTEEDSSGDAADEKPEGKKE